MKLNFKAFFFSLVVLPSVANGYTRFDGVAALKTQVAKVKAGTFLNNSDYGPIELWDVSDVTSMDWIFANYFSYDGTVDTLNKDISKWNVGKVTNMNGMFNGAAAFNGDISSWNTELVTDMAIMFQGAESFNQDISDWNVEKVTTMDHMFSSAISFNTNLNKWNVGNVQITGSMFRNATEFNQPIGNWDLSSLLPETWPTMWMFYEATSFNQNLCCWGKYLKGKEVNTMLHQTACSVPQPSDPLILTFLPDPIVDFCQLCNEDAPECSTSTDLETGWKIEPLEFVKIDKKIIINTPNHGGSGKPIWRVYQSPSAVSITDATDATSTCFSNGGEQYGGDGLKEVVLSQSPSILELSIVDGIGDVADNVNVYVAGPSPKVFFCVFLGLTESVAVDADTDADTEFFSFEELAFEVTMQLSGAFEATAFNAEAKIVEGKEEQTDYGVTATVGACGQSPVSQYNQGAVVPICVCSDDTITRVKSFLELAFKVGTSLSFTPVTTQAGETVLSATSSFNDSFMNNEDLSCKQIDSLLPQSFYNNGITEVIATGTVDLDIGGRRRTAEVNLRSLQNVEEKEFGAKFELAPATAEVESSAMSNYGMFPGMISVLLASMI